MSATATETWYRPGLVFWSPHAAYQVICRAYRKQLTPAGDVYDETRELLAEFAVHNGEYSYTAPDGTAQVASDIRGHYFDLDAQSEQKGWDDDEREIVARKLLREIVVNFPGQCRLYTAPKAVRPWPKYDSAHHNQVPVLAEQLGLVAEALVYERQNKQRASVIEKLEEALAAAPADETVAEDVEALTAA